MGATRIGPNPVIKSGPRTSKDSGPTLPVHDTNEWQDLADRADLVAEDRNEELEQLAGDEADWHPAPPVYDETQ